MLALIESLQSDRVKMQAKVPELSLQEKLMLTNHPAIKSALEQQLQEEIEAQNKLRATWQDVEEKVNLNLEAEAKKLGYRNLEFRLFIHPKPTRELRIMNGQIVHLHYYGDLTYLWSKEFFDAVRRAFPMMQKLMRTSALVVRSEYWRCRLDRVPKWKKIRIQCEEQEFNLLRGDEHQDEREVRIVKKHKQSGILVSVSGPLHMERSLEREALVILSQKVSEFKALRELHELENPVVKQEVKIGAIAEYFGSDGPNLNGES